MSIPITTQTSASLHARSHLSPSIEYKAWVDDIEAYVYNHTGFSGGTMSWIFLDLYQPITIKVAPHRKVDTARVLPRRKKTQLSLKDNTVTLRIHEPGSYQIEWDGNLELPFFIFARPGILNSPATPCEHKRIEFGPGEHRPGLIELKSGQELHLAPGAEVYGAIRAVGASNIRITGRGILRQSHLPFGGTSPEHNPLELIDCQDVVIDGPIFLDGCTWNIVFRNCDRVHVRHITVLSERPYSTDGINPCDSRDVLIEHCFARCKDDCVSIKGMQRDVPVAELKPIHNIHVRDCLFWSDNNNGLVIGTETWASEICHIRFERTDFVKVSGTCGDWAAAFAVQSLADTQIYDIVFEDIDVEHNSGNPFSVLYLNEVYGIPGQRRPMGGNIRDITFRNINFHQRLHRHSLVLGMDEGHCVENVRFEEISSGGEVVPSAEKFRIQTNGFVRNAQWNGHLI
jgi:hypothetical protein